MLGKLTRLYIKILIIFISVILILAAAWLVAVLFASAKFHDASIEFWGDLHKEGTTTHQMGGFVGMIVPQGGPLINAAKAKACRITDYDLLLPVRLPESGIIGMIEVLCPTFTIEHIEIEHSTFLLLYEALKGHEFAEQISLNRDK